MLSFASNQGVRFCDGMCRRDFLKVGSVAAGAVGLSLADMAKAASNSRRDVNCIVLFLVGGPSQLETWDPKPDAPANIRGPFRPIRTSVPGIHISEHFPLMAQQAEKFAILRSVNHQAAPIHETGHQLMQTGHLFKSGVDYPHYGAVVSKLRGAKRNGVPPFAVVPGPIGDTGVGISHGQGAGFLGDEYQPCLQMRPTVDLTNRTQLLEMIDTAQRDFDSRRNQPTARHDLLFAANAKRAYDLASEPETRRERYGKNTFGQSCLLARRLVEHGVRLVTVNMFDTVFHRITWDCHADGGALASTLHDYRETLCPMFDRAYTALLADLGEHGMLDNTLVVAMGEFGRTPIVNPRGGRDHWPGVWSILFAGVGVRGGQVIGSSDRTASEPRERPISPQEVAASVYHTLGIDSRTTLVGPDGRPGMLSDAAPIAELW